ncbi:hypothetical protein BIV57_02160 [Mangrovactinospora gilvigrisea]|uniref:FtsK domain-containing protein n=1 Tax=Mangrovactinospora gilvigrisea TaxID=1428644 RepID=A0A1J7CCB2_9ACTN|nr:FtsK/SpoIIIE domain-containing protein [Mangrovactinospora gilvigrisea]OIV39156.1 hypothetical protein BIV57_02160 [Mangrovactinospora gilvigrisea]
MGPTLREAVRLLFDPAVPAVLAGSLILLAAPPAGYLLLHYTGLALGVWVWLAWAIVQTRAVWRTRRTWRRTLFAAAAEPLRFPPDASPGRWVFIQRWERRTEPAAVVIRCPEGFDPAREQADARLSAAWPAYPELAAGLQWSFRYGRQKRQPDQWQVAAFSTAISEEAVAPSPSPQEAIPPQPPVGEEDAGSTAMPLARQVLRVAVLVGRFAVPLAAVAAAAWWVLRDPQGVWPWLTHHRCAAGALALPVLLGLAWFWLRVAYFEPRRGQAIKPYLLLVREAYGLLVWEDRWFLRLPMLALLGWGGYLAATRSSVLPAAVVLGAWYAVALGRVTVVGRQRGAIVRTMYAIARVNLDYERYWKVRKGQRPVGAWRRIKVAWTSTRVPGRVRVGFPTELRTTSVPKMRQFQEEWTQKAFPAAAAHPGLEWDFAANMGTTTIECRPYVPVNPTDVRLGPTAPADAMQFVPGQLARTGAWYTMDLRDSPHMLVCGETGSGKSATMETLAYQKARTGWQVQIADAGGSGGWARWQGRPGVVPAVSSGSEACVIALTYPQIGAMFAELRLEIDHRKTLLVDHRVSKLSALPPHVRPAPRLVVCDEWLSMLSSASAKSKDEDTQMRKAIATQVWGDWAYVILEGRKVGVHSITGAQRPDAAMFGGAFRDNIGIRIACGAMTDMGLRMMFGEGYRAPLGFTVQDGDDLSGLPRGRMLVRPGAGKGVAVVQGAWFGGENNDADLERYLPVGGTAHALAAEHDPAPAMAAGWPEPLDAVPPPAPVAPAPVAPASVAPASVAPANPWVAAAASLPTAASAPAAPAAAAGAEQIDDDLPPDLAPPTPRAPRSAPRTPPTSVEEAIALAQQRRAEQGLPPVRDPR